MTSGLGDADYRELLLLRTGLRQFLRLSEDFARDIGLTPTQHQLLLVVRGHDDPNGPTIGDVASYLLLRHHSAVELVNRAATAGLVARNPDSNDARIVRLTLTAAGQQALERLSERNLEELRRLAEHFRPLLADLDAPRVLVARVYEPAIPEGRRILVDRLWPRGLRKDALEFEWRKDLAPSDGLRKWYGHDVARFEEFAARYERELDDRTEELRSLLFSGSDPVVLLTATKDIEHSSATVLARRIGSARPTSSLDD